jgi:hypothetical protein
MSVWLIDMGYVVGVSGQRFKIDYIKEQKTNSGMARRAADFCYLQ